MGALSSTLDAQAVIFNLQRHMEPANASRALGLLQGVVASMDAPDPLTVRMVLNQPSGSFPAAFTAESNAAFIASPAALRANPAGFGRNPVGAGPFKFKEWVVDDHLTLVRNPSYWDKGRPYLDEITYRAIPDATTRGQSLQSGQVDASIATPVVQNQLKDNSNFKIYDTPANSAFGAMVNTQRLPGSDPSLRKAMVLAFNPNGANQVLYSNRWNAQAATCPPFTPSSPYCNKGIAAKPNLNAAKKLVAAYAAKGGRTNFTLIYTATGADADAQYIQQVLNSIGLSITLQPLATPVYFARVAAGDFDIVRYGSTNFVNPFPLWFQILYSGSPTNVLKVNNPQLDAALLQARDALDASDRIDAWKKAQKIIADNYLIPWYGVYADSWVAKKTVNMGPNYVSGTIMYPGDISLSSR